MQNFKKLKYFSENSKETTCTLQKFNNTRSGEAKLHKKPAKTVMTANCGLHMRAQTDVVWNINPFLSVQKTGNLR